MRTTDLHQGIVYGAATVETEIHPELATRLDYDHLYGATLNRFCVQAALGHPISVYGRGGQKRGYIEDHYYNVVHTRLEALGLEPHLLDDQAIDHLLTLAIAHLDRVDAAVLKPRIDWRRRNNSVRSAHDRRGRTDLQPP